MSKKKRHTYRFSVIEHYAQTIEVTASSCLEADKIARELASKLSLGKIIPKTMLTSIWIKSLKFS